MPHALLWECKHYASILTVAIDKSDREDERYNIKKQPQRNLQEPAAMLQVLIPLVAFVLDANHRQ